MVDLAVEELQRRGGQADEQFYTQVVERITAQSENRAYATSSLLTVLNPQGQKGETENEIQQIISTIMAGMMISLLFIPVRRLRNRCCRKRKRYAGAQIRLSTRSGKFWRGKFLGVLITLMVQICVLLVYRILSSILNGGNRENWCLAVVALLFPPPALDAAHVALEGYPSNLNHLWRVMTITVCWRPFHWQHQNMQALWKY